MKIVSFNINGIRARPHQLTALLSEQAPDIVGLQETKCPDDKFPHEYISELDYHATYFGQKGHYGVALLSKQKPETVEKGFPGDDETSQKRVIIGSWELPSGKKLQVINGYFPQGENIAHPTKFPAKRKYYEDMQELLSNRYRPTDYLVVIGDFNVAPSDNDLGIGMPNIKRWLKTGACSFQPEEREWLNRLVDWGLTDAYRAKYPDITDRYSWFSYRSRAFEREPKRGLRIDHLMVSAPLLELLEETGIDYELRTMEKPSDHAPVWATFDLN